MKFIFLLSSVLSFNVHAQKTLSSGTFQASVRPVLTGILGDFHEMIVLFPDFPKEIIPLIQELDTLTRDKENLRVDCPRTLGVKCEGQIKSIREKLGVIKGLSFSLLSRQKMSSSLHINTLAGMRLLNQFDSDLEAIKGYLDNASLILKANIPIKKETYYVLKQLDELNTLLSLALVEYIPYPYKDDFSHFYFNFIQPIQQQISKSQNYEFLNRNITSLNFSLNLLNMNLTKRNKKTPEGMAPYLSVIHNRWNSLLRYYF